MPASWTNELRKIQVQFSGGEAQTGKHGDPLITTSAIVKLALNGRLLEIECSASAKWNGEAWVAVQAENLKIDTGLYQGQSLNIGRGTFFALNSGAENRLLTLWPLSGRMLDFSTVLQPKRQEP